VLEFDPINQVTGEPWDITPEEGGPDLGVRIGDLPSPDGYWYEYRGIDGSIGGIVSFNDADPTQEYSFSILINDIHPYLIPENEYTIYLLDWESVEGWDTLTKFSFIPWTGGPYSQFTTIENSIAKIEISTRHFY
jgi:hypothetical protein